MSETLERLRNAGWSVEVSGISPFVLGYPATAKLVHWQYGTFYGSGSTVEHALEDALLSATCAWGSRAN